VDACLHRCGAILRSRYLAFIRAILAFGAGLEPGQEGQKNTHGPSRRTPRPGVRDRGGQDILTPVSHSEQLGSRIAGAELPRRPGCGHITFTRSGGETAALIREFLGRAMSRRS